MPFVFHELKHHLPSLKQFVTLNKNQSISLILPQIKSLGESTFDMYYGYKTVAEIINETAQFLTNIGAFELELYKQWIAKNGGFRQFSLSDQTDLTLRYLPQRQYIHLHPSRYANNTIRIKANAMKTAMVLQMLDYKPEFIQHVNEARKLIELSPIKLNSDINEIVKCYELFK